MSNPYLNEVETLKAFHALHLEGNYSFLVEDLQKLADAFIMAAMPAIIRNERALCIDVVRSLNSGVADKLREIRGHL
jgi:hypothetical protein